MKTYKIESVAIVKANSEHDAIVSFWQNLKQPAAVTITGKGELLCPECDGPADLRVMANMKCSRCAYMSPGSTRPMDPGDRVEPLMAHDTDKQMEYLMDQGIYNREYTPND